MTLPGGLVRYQLLLVMSAEDQLIKGPGVIRGGAWSFPEQEMRSANRWRDFPSRRSDDTGFRVVRELLR